MGLAAAALAAVAVACGDDGGTAGPTAAGAGARQITWLVEQPWGGTYNVFRPEGSSYYLRQILAGTVPVAGDFDAEGRWAWSTDLFTEAPHLTGDDPQTMVFPVAPGATWNDGEPIDVDDFRFAWFHNSGRDDQCVGCDPADTTGWELVDSIEAGDDGAVTITLRAGAADAEWYAHFGPSPYPAHVAEQQGFDWHTPEGMGEASDFFATTVPTWSGGPYVIDEVVPDERAILVPNPRWYGDVAPGLDRVVLEVIPNPGDWAVAVDNGELDGGAPLAFDPDVLARLQADGEVRTSVGSGGGTFDHLELNSASPALGDVAVRRAILTAIDVGELRRRTFGAIDPAPTLRTNIFFEASDPRHVDLLAGTGFGSGDVDAARALLDGAEVPPLRFVHGPTKAGLAEVVQAELAEIGLTVTLVPVAPGDALTTLASGSFDLAAFSLGGGPLVVGAPGQLFRSDSAINFTGVDDPEIDGLIDELRSVVDPDEVAGLANRIATLALDRATVLPLWDNPAYSFVRDGYTGVADNLYSSVRALDGIGRWTTR